MKSVVYINLSHSYAFMFKYTLLNPLNFCHRYKVMFLLTVTAIWSPGE